MTDVNTNKLRQFADVAEAGGKQHWANEMRLAIAEIQRLQRDAARYRWLLARLQAAYDGETNDDFDILTVFCSMQWGHRDQRRVEASISWTDARDEPLNLSAAIDAVAAEMAEE